ncbi:MAG TPA: 3-oxoacyl-[acyl-carrier-protein] synthase III C-terminal domain-containing protein [Gemmatimonadaceae bacterium]|nr:3-oxoacyl-[acyl-carrier-protein] synthase III C-terminal domain-containing protein [Gemmatimonadaceae bacterium]
MVTPAPSPAVGIAGAAYYLPPVAKDLRTLAKEGLLTGDVAPLETFGFARARVAQESHVEMAIHASRAVLEETDTDPADVQLVLYAGALASSSVAPCAPPPRGSLLHLGSVPELFRYPASILQQELDLTSAVVTGVNQQACASIFSAIQLGRMTLASDPDVHTVLCVASDRLPDGAPRDIIFNLVSDGACAVLLRRDAPRNRILAVHQVTKGMMYGEVALDAEVIAAYFPTAVTVIQDTLQKAQLTMDDIAWIIPHNVSLRSWEILLGMLKAPVAKLFSGNIARVGHTMAADNIINLRDADDAGLLKPGDRLLLFTFGFGLNWSCMILEH